MLSFRQSFPRRNWCKYLSFLWFTIQEQSVIHEVRTSDQRLPFFLTLLFSMYPWVLTRDSKSAIFILHIGLVEFFVACVQFAIEVCCALLMTTPKLFSGEHYRFNTLAHWMLPLTLIWETSVFWFIVVRLRCYSSLAWPLWYCFFAMIAVEGNQLSDPIPLLPILLPSCMSGCMKAV